MKKLFFLLFLLPTLAFGQGWDEARLNVGIIGGGVAAVAAAPAYGAAIGYLTTTGTTIDVPVTADVPAGATVVVAFKSNYGTANVVVDSQSNGDAGVYGSRAVDSGQDPLYLHIYSGYVTTPLTTLGSDYIRITHGGDTLSAYIQVFYITGANSTPSVTACNASGYSKLITCSAAVAAASANIALIFREVAVVTNDWDLVKTTTNYDWFKKDTSTGTQDPHVHLDEVANSSWAVVWVAFK